MIDLHALNPMQKEAVMHINGPLLILAGAGSGKTKAVTMRIAYLIEQGVSPYNIMAITFTNKAAAEMKERVRALIGDVAEDVFIKTFHSGCVRILRRDAHHIGYDRSFSIYDADDSVKLIRDCIRQFDLDEKVFKPKSILSAISSAKNEMKDDKVYEREVAGIYEQTVSKIYKLYQQRLQSNNAMDFDDIILNTLKLLKIEDILTYYQRRFQYIMVDEYQDTNTAQYHLIRLLSGKHNNLCVVGDDDQSIYGFRGANIRNILEFEKDFTHVHVIRLEQNYRSTQTILDTANSVIANNIARKNKTLWTENGTGQFIFIRRCQSEYEEGAFIAAKINSLVSQGAGYKEMAILYRANVLSRAVEEHLIKQSVPYRIYGGVRFYERKEIKDILSYIRIIANPNDSVSIKRIINVPKRGIGDTAVSKIENYCNERNISMYGALMDDNFVSGLKNKNIAAFVTLLKQIMQAAEKLSITELIHYMAEVSGYYAMLQEEGSQQAENRAENIKEFISKAAEFEKKSENPTLLAFLEDVSLVADIDNYNEDDNAISLMTLHSAKGLEFPYVFICGMEEGIFPSFRSIMEDNEDAVEEERRLCYVGITRAKKELYMTYANSRMQQGKVNYNAPSRFIAEIPPHFIAAVQDEKKRNITGKTKMSKKSFINNYTAAKQTPLESPYQLNFAIGDHVSHMKYGAGEVYSIQAAGADFEVGVEFEEFGRKKFMAKLSKLKKIEG